MTIKHDHIVMALTSVFCLLPMILSSIVYHDLPEQVVVQWNLEGNPNRFAPRAVAAFGLPIFFFVINIGSKLFLYHDPKRENISKTMKVIAEWLVPFLAITITPLILFMAMGITIPLPMIALVFVGIVLIVCGNYLPKSRQNYVVGIRLPWTLNNADNWNKTHRMAGYVYIFCGIALIIVSFIPFAKSILLTVVLLIIALLITMPILYSYILYQKMVKKAGE